MPNQPNILVIMTDQQKANSSHLYGNTFCETPNLERLANDGVLFKNTFTPHPLCMPARVSFWASQFPHTHGARRNETWMPSDTVHAFKLWKASGYHCGLIGKNHCFQHPDDLALFNTWCEISHGGLPDDPTTKGMGWFRPTESINAAHEIRRNMKRQNPRFGWATSEHPLEDFSTGLVAGQTTRFLEKYQNEPFVLWVSFPDPHEPYHAPQQYADLFSPEKIELPPWRDEEFDESAPMRNRILHEILGVRNDPEEHLYQMIASYYGMVKFLDDALGQILDSLDTLGLRENTIVVYCSDHGDFMGEHAMQCKGGVFYDCLTHVPLIVSWPRHIPNGQHDASMTNLIDVVPTLLQLQGIDLPRSMQGAPLPTLTNAEPRDAAFSEYGAGGLAFTRQDLEHMPKPWGRTTLMHSLRWREAEGRRKMVRTCEWKYVHDPMGDLDELYDLVNDPWELANVAADPVNQAVISDMRLRLADWSIQTEDAKPIPLPTLGA